MAMQTKSTSPELRMVRAIQAGNSSAFRRALEAGADVNCKDQAGWTPIFHAAVTGQLAIVDELREAGADVNLTDEAGMTARMHALALGDRTMAEHLAA